MRVGLSALTIAEYFREELQQVGMAWWIGLMDSPFVGFAVFCRFAIR